MTKKQLLLLAIVPLSLIVSSVIALRFTADVSDRMREPTLAKFLEKSLATDREFNEAHFRTVLQTLHALEQADRTVVGGLIDSCALFARGGLGLAALSVLTILAATRASR